MKTSTAKRDATPVIFRKFPNTGEVIALFPTLAATAGNPWPCLSYMKVGQHGVADPHLVRDTDPATDGEAATLKAELEAIGYCLEPVKRFTRRHFIARKLELAIP